MFRHHLYHFCLYFNPRPHEEGDVIISRQLQALLYFNPRPHEEGDRNLCTAGNGISHFNPRPHEEGDLFYSALTFNGI